MLDPYAAGVLKPDVHGRLVADLDNYARDAGIQAHWICDPLPELSDAEMSYLKQFRQHAASGDLAGMIYSSPKVKADQLFSALAGALVRNFIRARVMTLGTALEHLASHTMPELDCVLIPNFYAPFNDGGHIAAWQVNAIYDFLVQRQVEGLQTILYATGKQQLAKEYGAPLNRLLTEHYISIGS